MFTVLLIGLYSLSPFPKKDKDGAARDVLMAPAIQKFMAPIQQNRDVTHTSESRKVCRWKWISRALTV